MLQEEYEPRRRLPKRLRPQQEPEAAFSYLLRDARPADLPHILAIYNHYVVNSTVTFDERPLRLRELRARFQHQAKLGMPYLVAESPGGEILGYASVSPWKQKAAYRYTGESSIYLGPAATGKGLGRALLAELIDRARAAGLKELVAVVADQGAEASIALHERFGFREIGRMGRVGYKFERWLGTILLQKSLR